MARVLEKSVEIEAGPQRVWSVLADLEKYPEWNPFIPRIEGHLTEGSRLEVTIRPPGGRAMTFRPTVLAVEEDRGIRWLGTLGVRGLFDGEHSLSIEPAGPDRVRFVQRERFSGILVPLFRKALDQTLAGFEQMNSALKARAED